MARAPIQEAMLDRAHSPFTKSPAHRKVRALSIVLMSIMIVVGVVGSFGLLQVRGAIERLVGERVPAQTALLTTQLELERADASLERAISEVDDEARIATLAEHDRSVTRAEARGTTSPSPSVINAAVFQKPRASK